MNLYPRGATRLSTPPPHHPTPIGATAHRTLAPPPSLAPFVAVSALTCGNRHKRPEKVVGSMQ